jgi:signal transduction histidine kinase
VLSDGSQPVARLVLGRRADPADVVASLTSATRLALRNAQLSTVALARLAEVRASRRRVVTASDGERRRIERDLHDGAQQRLVGAGLHLRVALSDLSGKNRTVVRIEQAERKVLDALARLRRLAHGIFPRVLSDDGLEAALDELVLESDIPARLEVRIEDDLPANVSMAVYALVAAMLGSVTEPRPSTLCTIDVRLDGAVLMTLVTVEAGGAVVAGFDLTAVEDRIGAAGGELVMVAGGAKAVIPCEL